MKISLSENISNNTQFILGKDLVSVFGSTQKGLIYLQALKDLPYFGNKIVRFVDFDDTLVARYPELYGDDGVKAHRGDSLYAHVEQRGGVDWYIEKFHRGAMARFVNYKEALYGDHLATPIILTAGNVKHQTAKIIANDFGNIPRIIVNDSERKMEAIVRFIKKLGYIPGSIEFIDDRIDSFVGADRALSRILGVSVVFEKAIPDGSNIKRSLVQDRSLVGSSHFTLQ